MKKYKIIASPTFFLNTTGTDSFPLVYGSAGSRVEQLKQALTILGESISENDFGVQTKAALTHLGYGVGINDENKFNEVILRAYTVGKKKMTLTEPQMRALWMKEVSPARRDKVTFEVWLKRQGIKQKFGEGGKAVFDVLFGWLKLKAGGLGSTAGMPAEQPVDTDGGGWFSKTDDQSIPTGYIVIGSAILLGLGIWGVSAAIKHSRVQPKIAQ